MVKAGDTKPRSEKRRATEHVALRLTRAQKDRFLTMQRPPSFWVRF